MTPRDELQLRLRQQEILAELGTFALQGGDIEALFQEATRVVAIGLETSFCKVLQYLPDEDEFLVIAGVGWREGVIGHEKLGADERSPAGYALKIGEPVISNALDKEDRFETPPLLLEHGITRAANVIIRAGDAHFGVLEIDARQREPFDSSDLAFLQGAANMLGVALERTWTDRALSASHTRITEILESISDAFYATDADGRFTYVNNRAETWFGQPRNTLLGKVYWEVFPQLAGTDIQAAHQQAMLERRPVRLETISPVLDHWVDISVFPSDSGLSVFFRDIAERKETEAALRRFTETLEQRVAERTRELAEANEKLTAEITERQKAEAALMQAQRLEAIGQLTGGVAHDFNNLLTAVIGNLELLRPRQTTDRTRRQADAALQAARRGGELTRQLLAYARKQHVELQAVPVNAVVYGMMDLLVRSLGGLVAVDTTLDPDLWPALGDPAQLESVILNLAINARDAMPAGGRLRITTRNVPARDPALPAELEAGEYVQVAVADEGMGMAPDVMAKAFEPFFTTKDIGKGSGLGLAQVDGVARQFGGAARLRSAVGRGTTVEVFLRRSAEAEPEMAPAAASVRAEAASGITILVVDDQPDVRTVAATFLEDAGYRVRQAGSGQEGLAVLDSEPVALALVDHGMAGMSGVQFVRAARQRHPDLPVIYVTGHAKPLDTEGADRADTVLNKPYGRETLLSAVARIVDPGAGSDDGASGGD